MTDAVPLHPTFAQALRVWIKVGLLSFGGPAGQIALMHRILVDEKRWVSEARFLHALNFCMLLPGPEAQQLAVYVGWLLHRTVGGIVAGVLFVLPGAAVVLALSVLYAGYHDLPLVQAAFVGIKAAVLAVVIEAVLRIGRRVLKNSVMMALAALAFAAVFLFQAPFPLVVLAAAAIGFAGARIDPATFAIVAKGSADAVRDDYGPHTRPSLPRTILVVGVCCVLWFASIVALAVLDTPGAYLAESIFFSKMAVVTFGGAYAVLAYVAQQAVEVFAWLTPGEMVDGLGLAETTPGPLILVLQFVGFLGAYRDPGTLSPLAGGIAGAVLTTWVTFVPCFLWILAGAPYVEALRGHVALSAALSAITAAVVGVVLNLAVWFGLHVLFGTVGETHALGMRILLPDAATLDPIATGIAIGAALAILRYHAPMLPTLAVCAALGLATGALF